MPDEGYTLISNQLFRDSRLPANAVRVYGYMRSHTEGWAMTTRRVADALGQSVSTIERAIRELEDAGYIVRKRHRKADGTWSKMEYVIMSTPQKCGLDPTSGNEVSSQVAPVLTYEEWSGPAETGRLRRSRPVLTYEGHKKTNKEDTSANPTTAAEPPRADVDELCQRLASLIENNGARKPTVTKKWRDEARRLLDRDKVPFDDAMAIIEWCQNDHFWKANILSMPKFREKFDQLKLKAGHLPRPSVGLIDHALATGDVSELIEATGIMYDFRWPGGVMPSDPDERARVRAEFNKRWVAENRSELDARLRRSA